MTDSDAAGHLMVKQGLLSAQQLETALEKMKDLGRPLPEVLLNMKLIDEKKMIDFYQNHFEIEYLDLAENDYEVIDRSLRRILNREMCESLRVIPVFLLDDGETKDLTLALVDPTESKVLDQVTRYTSTQVTPVLTTAPALNAAIDKMFGQKLGAGASGDDLQEIEPSGKQLISFINKILVQAVESGASDIHFEPQAEEALVRFRVDGALRVVSRLSRTGYTGVSARLKVMGSEQNALMKLDEKRLPQDGSFSRLVVGHTVDFRVSSIPMIYGEKVVLRVLDKDRESAASKIDGLRMPPRLEQLFRRVVNQVSGIVLVTGPTGSGKSTTLYAGIKEINQENLNIVTIEDPVEIHVGKYVNQSSLMPHAGYTYPKALRSVLRQDPDVILIGEIRDLESAQIAIQAALTGHLVLSTLHTEDAASAVVRLVDLGIEELLVASTVALSVNQRLLRKVCDICGEPYQPDEGEITKFIYDKAVAEDIMAHLSRYTFRKGRGCPVCHQTGYRGRQAAFEMLHVTTEVKNMILNQSSSDAIVDLARSLYGINMLLEEGIRLVLSGITTFEELKKIPRGHYEIKAVDQIFKDAGLTS